MWSLLLDAVFPEKCAICHDILKKGSTGALCSACRRQLHPVTEPRCKRCSKSLEVSEEELCGDCRGKTFYVAKGMALYSYDHMMQTAIANFKYGGELSCGTYFAGELIKRYGTWVKGLSPEVILPVPVHKKKLCFRGFNQAEYMAAQIGMELGIPVEGDYLIRTENTKPQKGLDVRARIKNLQKSFGVIQTGRRYRSVLLVDDIYTTGATLEACGKALKEAGTDRIYFLCLCIGRGE